MVDAAWRIAGGDGYTDLRYPQLDIKGLRPLLLAVQHCKSAGSLWTSTIHFHLAEFDVSDGFSQTPDPSP
jgi:hypothetical protein